MGMESIVAENDIVIKEAVESPDKIGNILKPQATKCMPACKVQDYDNQISSVSYPQQDIFFHQKLFCDVASHIWRSTCQDENRAYVLNKKQPLLCPILMDFNEFFSQLQMELSMVNIHMHFASFKRFLFYAVRILLL